MKNSCCVADHRQRPSTPAGCGVPSLAGRVADRQDDEYAEWDRALADAAAVYPTLGRPVWETLAVAAAAQPWAAAATNETVRPGTSAARDLRKCLEGALYGQDAENFVVTQPHCAANKNLDFGRPKTSLKAAHKSRNKVENWMSKYV